MVIAIIFWVIGLVVTSFTILPVLICLVFGIPTTKKLERANMLVENPIIKRYMVSIGLLIVIFIVVSGLIFTYGSIHALRGYIGGGQQWLPLWAFGKLGETQTIYPIM